MAVSSSSPAVASRCAHARAGVGAVATQNITDPELGPLILDQMARGQSASQAVTTIAAQSENLAYRQVLVVDAAGRTAVHSGAHVLGVWGVAQGPSVAAGGNLLANASVPQAMVDAFAIAEGHLGNRLLAALKAGLLAGGEAGPVHSAGLLVADRLSWPIVDLRCDWTTACPIAALDQIWRIYHPQIDAYVQRAQDPGRAPSYGVPGDG